MLQPCRPVRQRRRPTQRGRAVSLPIDVVTTTQGSTVTVTVTHIDPVDVAIVGPLIGPIEHTASSTMAMEPP